MTSSISTGIRSSAGTAIDIVSKNIDATNESAKIRRNRIIAPPVVQPGKMLPRFLDRTKAAENLSVDRLPARDFNAEAGKAYIGERTARENADRRNPEFAQNLCAQTNFAP